MAGMLTVEVGVFFFQAEDGIRGCLLSRGLGDVYKRQDYSGIEKNQAEAARRAAKNPEILPLPLDKRTKTR